ncbi:hypothetical protein DK880_00380 [Candidatus Cardinium hertigii]|uniref:Uncharacterized protein n=1 Tax=Candidatus Cardinium hertigii TaxID=247481 RepID=A0A2Z3L7U5_9BACT|nr:hypothetical protein DK880_00380 [Candidatus Cardinium hertigii]
MDGTEIKQKRTLQNQEQKRNLPSNRTSIAITSINTQSR